MHGNKKIKNINNKLIIFHKNSNNMSKKLYTNTNSFVTFYMGIIISFI